MKVALLGWSVEKKPINYDYFLRILIFINLKRLFNIKIEKEF